MAVALEVPELLENPTNESVRAKILELGYDLNSMKGVKGLYYTTDRIKDLKDLVVQILTVRNLRSCLTDDLRRSPWKGSPNLVAGHCYIASEALQVLLGDCWKPVQIMHEGSSHWYLKHERPGIYLDATADQFQTPVPYEAGTGRGFLTRAPSARTQELLNRMGACNARSQSE